MYAIVEVQGKQYRVEQGKEIKVDLMKAEPGTKVELETVMFVSDKDLKVGNPYIKGAKLQAVVEKHFKDKKTIVFKYKPKKNYRRTQGHRQQYTTLRIEGIAGV